jgi:hypothetical protein
MGKEEISVSILKIQGGYVVYHPNGSRVETSLNKVMAFVKEVLSEELVIDIRQNKVEAENESTSELYERRCKFKSYVSNENV